LLRTWPAPWLSASCLSLQPSTRLSTRPTPQPPSLKPRLPFPRQRLPGFNVGDRPPGPDDHQAQPSRTTTSRRTAHPFPAPAPLSSLPIAPTTNHAHPSTNL